MAHVLNEDNLIEEDTVANKYLLFSVDKEIYGAEIKNVEEIIGIQDITHVPQLPEFIKGIINLRGNIIPVGDLRIRFKKEAGSYMGKASIVILNLNEVVLGIIIDNALEVITIMPDEIQLPPEMSSGYKDKYVKGIAKVNEKIVLLLNIQKLISEEELDEIKPAIS
ncbi:MAG: chemotaxis protein CheW [Bacillota bacterium]|nr:chemotaxis protein CheW [Bacillota bacterium]